uniref:Uncharacterized protein n=1 Tax=Arundo donax TaxID=35708 RepID=A0A0A8YPJ7_ARUDO
MPVMHLLCKLDHQRYMSMYLMMMMYQSSESDHMVHQTRQ